MHKIFHILALAMYSNLFLIYLCIHVTLLLTMVTAILPLRQHTTSSPGHAKVLPEVVVQSADSGMRIGGCE